MIWITLLFHCFLFPVIDAAGASSLTGSRQLRGALTRKTRPSSRLLVSKFELDRSGAAFGPEAGPVGEKPEPIKDAEEVEQEWFVPFASLMNIVFLSWRQLIVSASVWIFLVLIISLVYKNSSTYIPEAGSKPADPTATQLDFTRWRSAWYQCYDYPGIFVWACCCPCIRWAHNMDLLQFLDFWPAFFLFLLFEVLNQLTAFIFIGAFFTMLLVFYRQRTRKLFGMPDYGTCSSYTVDCLGFCFCWPCLIAQEAHHITEAAKMGWTKDLAAKTGIFSARNTPRISDPAAARPALPTVLPARPAFLDDALPPGPSASPSTSGFVTPLETPRRDK